MLLLLWYFYEPPAAAVTHHHKHAVASDNTRLFCSCGGWKTEISGTGLESRGQPRWLLLGAPGRIRFLGTSSLSLPPAFFGLWPLPVFKVLPPVPASAIATWPSLQTVTPPAPFFKAACGYTEGPRQSSRLIPHLKIHDHICKVPFAIKGPIRRLPELGCRLVWWAIMPNDEDTFIYSLN